MTSVGGRSILSYSTNVDSYLVNFLDNFLVVYLFYFLSNIIAKLANANSYLLISLC